MTLHVEAKNTKNKKHKKKNAYQLKLVDYETVTTRLMMMLMMGHAEWKSALITMNHASVG